MTQEEKELLIKDLCGRLSCGVKCKIEKDWFYDEIEPYDSIFNLIILERLLSQRDTDYCVKPYLRPMSSMTEEEFESLKQYSGLIYDQLELAEFQNGTYKCLEFYLSEIPSYIVILVFDWLNAHHFDYRGLIPMGLALEAPEDMYNI